MSDRKSAPLDGIAPYPRRGRDVTAEAIIKHYAAFGLMHSFIALNAASALDPQFKKSIAHSVSSFTTVYLLREIVLTSPERANAIARDLWMNWEGGELGEWLWEWLAAYGIDPAPIEGIAAEVEKNIREKAAKAEMPSGGEA